MGKSYKMKNDKYIDSSGIVHNNELLSNLLSKVKFVSINNVCQNFELKLDTSLNYSLGYVFDADGDIFEFHKPKNGNLTINRLIGNNTLTGVYNSESETIKFTLNRTSIFFYIYT